MQGQFHGWTSATMNVGTVQLRLAPGRAAADLPAGLPTSLPFTAGWRGPAEPACRSARVNSTMSSRKSRTFFARALAGRASDGGRMDQQARRGNLLMTVDAGPEGPGVQSAQGRLHCFQFFAAMGRRRQIPLFGGFQAGMIAAIGDGADIGCDVLLARVCQPGADVRSQRFAAQFELLPQIVACGFCECSHIHLVEPGHLVELETTVANAGGAGVDPDQRQAGRVRCPGSAWRRSSSTTEAGRRVSAKEKYVDRVGFTRNQDGAAGS